MTAKPNNPLATHDIFKTVRKLYSNGSASFASKCHDFKYGALNPLLSHIWLKSSLFSTNLSPLIYIVCVHYTHLLTTEDMLFQSQNEYWLKLFYEKVIPGSNLTSEYSLNTRMPFSCKELDGLLDVQFIDMSVELCRHKAPLFCFLQHLNVCANGSMDRLSWNELWKGQFKSKGPLWCHCSLSKENTSAIKQESNTITTLGK